MKLEKLGATAWREIGKGDERDYRIFLSLRRQEKQSWLGSEDRNGANDLGDPALTYCWISKWIEIHWFKGEQLIEIVS